ncbi:MULTISPECIES: lactoferrin/transferrin family TonB-dependent receptor [Glaesserella]|uniref:Lactoferrin/transferrin family TonB-dependent receptor n=1 Tax=Glaesserella australis TaxID=2094024 RepID=A0A328BZU2_9PAST|nr:MULTISPECIES: lactoferrin/transferrin family TonB-dependent receptor [Glaesserella]AUI66163.1 transferrin-binding protein [Glaesserella sp. 15-184]RAL19185.1 lactoferrin/transferrin family TonB-dependent receptor [Glaesserella australis]
MNNKLNLISLALLGLFSVQAYAEQAVELNDVYVTGTKKKVHKKENEVTGLGKVVKSSDSLNKEQVLNIRDLTRYDPGISVVEQGRGATTGYSIRGVDRNRVGLALDGLPQIQSYVNQYSSSSSGAINEIEYENLRSIQISKGASSSEFGSGSLGGSVQFRTKDASDIIKAGQSWGLDTKSAYSSKNQQWLNSVAFAGTHNGFDALVIYTHRNGKEIQAHKDVEGRGQNITRVGVETNTLDVSNRYTTSTNNQQTYGWFLLKDQCPTLDCSPKQMARATKDSPSFRTYPEYTVEEKQAYENQKHITERLNAKDYTGEYRALPDPLKYKSDAWLVKLGYAFSPKHYVSGIYEHSKQRYDTRDMTYTSYWQPSDLRKAGGDWYPMNNAKGLYHTNAFDGVAIDYFTEEGVKSSKGLRWAKARFIDEWHTRDRLGGVYRYTNQDENRIIDSLSLSFDQQKIKLSTRLKENNCSEYPIVDKNCRATIDKLWSATKTERSTYAEKHDTLQLSLEKTLKTSWGKHQFNALLGSDRFNSTLARHEILGEFSVGTWTRTGGNSTYSSPYIYELTNQSIYSKNECDYTGNLAGRADCSTRKIKGHNHYIAVRDNFALTKYLDIGLGYRFDTHKFRSNHRWASQGDYKNSAWNIGVVAKPASFISFSYRASSGFRVPSFQELFGLRYDGAVAGSSDAYQKPVKLSPEKSLNQEVAVTFKGDFGIIETSFFKNDYKQLIAPAERMHQNQSMINYFNVQDIKLNGVNIIGKLDWNGIWDRIPEGIYTTLAYSKMKVKAVKNYQGYMNIRSPLLDTIQPARYVIGIGYDQPDEKWGINLTMTHSSGKDPDELKGQEQVGFAKYERTATTKRTRSWQTFDLTGYITPWKHVTIRAGIYNLMNYRYTTWESVRQSSLNAIHQHTNVKDYARYAAPGRNYVLSLEMKF